MQQPGPPSKLSRSHSADNLAAGAVDPPRAPAFATCDNLADEVDYGDLPEPSLRMSRKATSSSSDSSPAASTKPSGKEKSGVDRITWMLSTVEVPFWPPCFYWFF